MLLRGNIAQHGSAIPAYLRCANGRSDMVIARCDIGNEWTEGVERCLMTLLQLAIHVSLNLVHGYMSRAFYKHLYIAFPCCFHQFAHRFEFCKLRTVVGIVSRAGAQTIAKR